jgi:hypothetical protein
MFVLSGSSALGSSELNIKTGATLARAASRQPSTATCLAKALLISWLALAAYSCKDDAVQACHADGGAWLIQASDYDRSCTTDADCVPIGEGDACAPCTIACTTAVISKAAKPRYIADLGGLFEASQSARCHCPFSSVPCCREGQCHADQACSATKP